MNDKLMKQMKLLDDPLQVKAILVSQQIQLTDSMRQQARCGSVFKTFTLDGWKCLACFVWSPFEVKSAIYSLPPGVTQEEALELFEGMIPSVVEIQSNQILIRTQSRVDDLLKHARAAEKETGKHHPERLWLQPCVPGEN